MRYQFAAPTNGAVVDSAIELASETMTFMLSIVYLLASLSAVLVVALCGAAWYAPRGRGRVADRLIELPMVHGVGLAFLSTLVVVLGLGHLLKAWLVLPVVVLTAAVGVARLRRNGTVSVAWITGAVRWVWRGASVGEKTGIALCAIVFLAISANVLVGAMAPDNSQDTLWYHLTVPGQWVLRGDVRMFTHVMPSTYTLGAEAVYAALLMAGDGILVTCFYAWHLLMAMAFFPLVAWRLGGLRCAVLAAALAVPAYAVVTAIAPVGAMNEAIAAMLLGLAGWAAARPVLEKRDATMRDGALAGALAGMALATKIVTLAFWGPAALLILATVWVRSRKGVPPLRYAAVMAIAGAAVLSPWLIRGFVESGNPVIHVSQEMFPLRDEFRPVLKGYDREPRLLLPTRGNLTEWLRLAKMKFEYAGTGLNLLFLVFPVAGLVCLMRREGYARLQGVIVLSCYGAFLLFRGQNETVKYFSTSYLLMAPALAFLLKPLANSRLFLVAVVAILLGTTGTYAKRQLRWAGFERVNWHFRPVLTDADRLEWVAKTERGPSYLFFHYLQGVLPKDAVVLTTHSGPYYLHRQAYWSDFSCACIVQDWLRGRTADAFLEILRGKGIDYLVIDGSVGREATLVELERRGDLREVALEGDWGEWRVWRVVDRTARRP